MSKKQEFTGFPKECVKFFKDLAKNNNKQWFDENKDKHLKFVVEPSKDFVVAMGEKLRAVAPKVNADPRVNKSLFRIHRDTRFSHDKSPYKTHLGLWMWEGAGARMDCPGFYFHIDPPTIMLGVGYYIFPKPILPKYREAVVDRHRGRALRKAIDAVAKSGDYALGGEHYKRVPRGFDPEHRNADLLRYNSMWAGIEMKIPKELYTPEIVDFCYAHYKNMNPLHRWLKELAE